MRSRALDRLRANAERAGDSSRSARATAERRWGSAPPAPSPYQTLIEVLLHDDAVDEAWELAIEHGCSQYLWMALAKGREPDHPLEAVGVYQREIEQLIARKTAHTYEAAVDLIGCVVGLLRAHASNHAADEYLTDIRHRHKPKAKFLGLLGAAGL